jgi:hypothetical protein
MWKSTRDDDSINGRLGLVWMDETILILDRISWNRIKQ